MPSISDQRKAQRLVQEIILEQKNTYIKELLRKYSVPGGATKAQFEDRLDQAITDGTITLDHLKEWIDETEGWGDEHVYLYRLPKTVCVDLFKKAESRARQAGLGHLWNARPSVVFPNKRRLTAISIIDDELRFVWHQGATLEERAPDRDLAPREEYDGETYSYKAYRHFGKRNVTRIVARLSTAMVAVFLPGSSEPAMHARSAIDALRPRRA